MPIGSLKDSLEVEQLIFFAKNLYFGQCVKSTEQNAQIS